MAAHDYSPRDALDILMRKVREKDEQLAQEIQSAIDAGKDIEERESSTRRRKPRIYRKTVRFSDQEALNIAIDALEACFIEQPLFVKSADDDFRPAAIGERPGRETDSKKTLEIELQTETQISIETHPTVRLDPVSDELVDAQKYNIAKLRSLATFGGD